MGLALRASGLWLRYTTLQNLPSGNLGWKVSEKFPFSPAVERDTSLKRHKFARCGFPSLPLLPWLCRQLISHFWLGLPILHAMKRWLIGVFTLRSKISSCAICKQWCYMKLDVTSSIRSSKRRGLSVSRQETGPSTTLSLWDRAVRDLWSPVAWRRRARGFCWLKLEDLPIFFRLISRNDSFFWSLQFIQGDPSSCSQPPVDIKTKVAFQYMLLILKHNFCCDVNSRLGTNWCVTL